MLRGGLFTREYLLEGIQASEAWKALDDSSLAAIRIEVEKRLAAIQKLKKPTEAETEAELIWPVLRSLGWENTLPQQNLSFGGREKVPDGLLFGDSDAKDKAAAEKSWSRFRHGLCLMEAKRWNRILDRGDKTDPDDAGIPSNQILSYLRRVDDVTRGKLRWGILTNGRQWRLYFQGADSVAEEYLEIDLGGVFHLSGYQPGLLDDARFSPDHVFRLFVLLFGRDAFLSAHHGQTLHALVRDQGKHWEAGVAADLSRIVFDELYPGLVKAIAAHDPNRDTGLSAEYLSEVRQGALIFLYRLLFVLYAEDRHLLPVERDAYKEFALTRLRDEIAKKFVDHSDFSDRSTLYCSRLETIFRAIGEGDDTLGIPPYNGGLFQQSEAPILARTKLSDSVVASIIYPLSHERAEPRPKYINYRDLSVQQLGSIYERLLEFDVVAEGKDIAIRLNSFARKGSGSYYTPEPLVKLIIERTVGPLAAERLEQFRAQADELGKSRRPLKQRLDELSALDPASRILELKICDPAMGSGHFLVSLVDWMADRVLATIEDAADIVDWAGKTPYESPLIKRIAAIRSRIEKRAKEHNWPLPERQLDERNIIRRMILKRCVYGVDLNPMAVELAKVSLWLHTFTVGAPLSFLDHHLRCGNSLFGEHVRGALDWLAKRGNILISDIIKKAKAVSAGMEKVEGLTDADIAEVKESETNFESVEIGIRPIVALLDFIHVLRWQDPKDDTIKKFVSRFLDGQYGDPLSVVGGRLASNTDFAEFYAQCRREIVDQRFLHWEVAFPGVWSNWESTEPQGGFDAVIGNPPWDRMKMQEVEWFAARAPEVALQQRAADRRRLIQEMKEAGDPLIAAYERASERADKAMNLARTCGDYPLLSVGDINIYALFVERASHLIKKNGTVGLVTPSGIASDKTAAPFFRSISTTGRLESLFDFENKKVFFPDVHASFKFCTLTFGGADRKFPAAKCAFYVHDIMELDDPERCFLLRASDFDRVNPNTATAPIFRTRRDAQLITDIYERIPVLVSHTNNSESKTWPIHYATMFHMSNDSHFFRTAEELAKKEQAYPVGGNIWRTASAEYIPLYQGRSVEAYDHRFAGVDFNPENIRRGYVSVATSLEEHKNPDFSIRFQYYVPREAANLDSRLKYVIAYRRSTATTNARTMVSAIAPATGFGDSLFLLVPDLMDNEAASTLSLIQANLMSIPFDFVARNKLQGQNFSWYILEQLPVVPGDAYARSFGKKSAAEIVRSDVLALTYTANDMEPFARDMGYTGEPFAWDEADRVHRRARLDALYFMLYFPSGNKAEIETLRETAHYIFSTFPIVEREDMATHGRYLSRDLCLAYINALAAGDPDASIEL